jgi:hypothetical protein
MRKPNFLCIGTFRAGTTWLYHVLKSHPDVFLAKEKELMFFSHHYGNGIGWYENCFQGYNGEKLIGEISPSYLGHKHAPERIKEDLPGVKLIATLRNPVDQVYSSYNMRYSRKGVREEFSMFLKNNPYVLDRVLYFKHIQRYMRFFDKKDTGINI